MCGHIQYASQGATGETIEVFRALRSIRGTTYSVRQKIDRVGH
jgi:hypothetical protein